MIINTTCISFYEGNNQFEFPCKVNLETKEVFDIQVDPEVVKEFNFFFGAKVKLFDGTEHNIYPKEMAIAKNVYWSNYK